MDIENRFWEKVRKTKTCWWWIACKRPQGYGLIRHKGKTHYAHRMSWIITNGEIPQDLCVLHKCNNPSCVRPSHLYLGTKQNNSDDKLRIGNEHHPIGIKNGRAILTPNDVTKIRSLHKPGISYKSLSKRFGVSLGAINGIVNRRTWKWL